MTEQIDWGGGGGGHSNHHKWLASGKILNVEKLETLPADTKPRTSHHRSPGGGVERGSVRRSSLKGREGAIVNAGETSERRDEAHMGFSERTDTLFN